jgi:hypothetical protein
MPRRKKPLLPSNDDYFESLSHGPYSTPEFATFIARELAVITRRPWSVELIQEGKGAGGMVVRPAPERLTKGGISREDWRVLEELFDAYPCNKDRWGIFSDELEWVLYKLAEAKVQHYRDQELNV